MKQNIDLAKSCTYDLQSVVVHVGKIETGHYTSYSRSENQVRSLLSHVNILLIKSSGSNLTTTL